MDKLIISYHDSCLYKSDIEILNSETEWLNDRIISFYLDYLQHEIYESKEILFLGSEVTQAIKMMGNPEEINAVILDPLNVKEKNFLIFPINDNSKDQVGGSHWSLLVYSKSDNTFYHFDSSGSSNYYVCSKLAKIIKSCLKLSNEKIVQVECLQQNNSYDCGIYVLCHADSVCKAIMKSNTLKDIKKISYKTVLSKRSELLEIIKSIEDTK
ncbi:sentrin-specific protease 8 [Chironomus tepperi]|uniref:sentrin-specific protease 8 n=1 Tax=Chironomus tepperi TaxID=113505 RepID=UPI00391FB9CF